MFRLPREAAPDVCRVTVAGNSNNWVLQANPMEKAERGGFVLTLELEAGKEHEFRDLIDESRLENAWNAGKYGCRRLPPRAADRGAPPEAIRRSVSARCTMFLSVSGLRGHEAEVQFCFS